MSTPILLPKLGFSMHEGTLAEWLVADGAQVQLGQPIYSLESEKTVQDVEASVAGKIRIVKPAGAAYPVGTLLGEIS
jgi:pyruvate/2-oxoglutarate dehydrogenase complex dihydrolipoamide acyltransferase (E2) component